MQRFNKLIHVVLYYIQLYVYSIPKLSMRHIDFEHLIIKIDKEKRFE